MIRRSGFGLKMGPVTSAEMHRTNSQTSFHHISCFLFISERSPNTLNKQLWEFGLMNDLLLLLGGCFRIIWLFMNVGFGRQYLAKGEMAQT